MDPQERVWREQTLRCAVLAGDEQAWRTWYDESYGGLAAYVAWRCAGLRDVAEEVVQETWLTAVRRIGRFEPERGSFAGWLRGIAANLLRNSLRRKTKRERRLQTFGRACPTADPADTALVQREAAEQVARALAALSERNEAVLRAKYLDGQSVLQIAEGWGETPKAVESLLTRARQAFRDAYLRRE
jgi:RNA polymerase sigma-70 factor (ECF subfamily)